LAKELEAYLNVRHVAPCGNGTDALQIALMALGLKPGDEVITVPFTFVATVEVVALLGMKPVFVDVDSHTFNIDPDQIESRITEKTKCIVPVHLYGQCADMEAIMATAKKHNLPVVEDNAQAIGADFIFKNKETAKAGTIADIGTTSFYPSKNLGAYGDAGAIFTNDSELAERIRVITNHGSDRKYYYDSVGVNSRLDSLQAAILRTKLALLNSFHTARQKVATYYDTAFKENPNIQTPARAPYSTHVFHQYTLKVNSKRDELQTALASKGIPSMIYYPVPLHLSGAYSHYGYKKGDFPVSEQLADQVISLPMHTELDEEQLAFICENVNQFFS
jgi:dTDP-4-amino-4,6-dideoxygalactose transaminase